MNGRRIENCEPTSLSPFQVPNSRIWNSTWHFHCFLPQHSSGETVSYKQRSALVLVILDCSIVFPLLRNVYYYVSRTSNSAPYSVKKIIESPMVVSLRYGRRLCSIVCVELTTIRAGHRCQTLAIHGQLTKARDSSWVVRDRWQILLWLSLATLGLYNVKCGCVQTYSY